MKKKFSKNIDRSKSFDEIDYRLACGWHVEIEGSGQRKRYLKQLNQEKFKNLNKKEKSK
tara:strand:- start:129 stop:305 length:177 start_codon:yes stop_codon:yes gene_type:complete